MKFLLLAPLFVLANCSGQQPLYNKPAPTPRSVADKSFPSGPPPQPKCPQFHAQFLVTQNSLYSEKVRSMQVYLAPASFGKNNLRKLFACLSESNPEPEHLIIKLETDMSRVQIPDGRPGSGTSGRPPDPHKNDFLRAIYFRRPGRGDNTAKEYFRYSPRTHVDEFHFTTVIIKKK